MEENGSRRRIISYRIIQEEKEVLERRKKGESPG